MLKKCGRSFISLLLVFILVASVFTISGSAAVYVWGTNQTKSLTFGSKKIEFKNVKTNTSSSGSNKYGEMYLNDGTEKSVEFIIRSIGKTYQKLTFEAYVPAGYVMHFDYRIEKDAPVSDHNFKFAPAGSTTDVNYDLIDGYSYILVSGTSSGGASNRSLFTIQIEGSRQEYHAFMEHIELVQATSVDVNVKAPQNGSVLVNNTTTVSSGGSDLTLNDVGTDSGVVLDATPASGYAFAGYKINNSSTLTAPTGTNYTFFPTTSGDTIEAVFVPQNQPQFLVGNMNGFEIVSSLRDAIDTAEANNYHLIIPITDVTVEDDGDEYTIPSGVTLVVPNNAEHNVYTTDPCLLFNSGSGYRTKNPDRATTLAKIGATAPYVTMTLSAGVVLNVEQDAAISVGGTQFSPNGGGSACVKGGYGMIKLDDGAKINVFDGGYLYAWGFIVSTTPASDSTPVMVECEPGASVYEMFQITDYTGGSIISDIALPEGGSIFPFSQYYVQNIETKLKLNAGAKEYVAGALTVSSNAVSTGLLFIGQDGGMFTLNSGCAIKYYDVARDKLICRLDENAVAAINPLALNVGIDLDTNNFQLPISNIGVEVAGNSTVEINQDLQLYPDSYVTIDDGCELTVQSNIYVADTQTIAGHVMGGGSVRPLVYSATIDMTDGSGNGASPRTADTLGEPYVVNDGSVTINAVEKNGREVGSINLVGEGGTITGTGAIVNNATEVEPEEIKLVAFYRNEELNRLAGKQEPDPGEAEPQCVNIDAFDEEGNALSYRYDTDREVWHTDQVTLHFVNSDDPENPDDVTVDYGEEVTFPVLTKEGYVLTWYNDEDHTEIHNPGSKMQAYDFATYVTDWHDLPVIDIDDPSHSLSLEGMIHVNFYWPLTESSDGYTYTFSLMGKTTDQLPLPTDPDENFGYKTSVAVNAPEMTEEITATLYYEGSPVKTDTFRAVDYAASDTFNAIYKEYDTELQNDTPYLMGTINGSTDWTKASPMYKFTENPINPDEYMLASIPLTAGDSFKVVKYYTATESYGYYPDGTDNNYTVAQNGVYNIYFKKNPDVFVDGWHYGKFYVETISTDTADYQNALLPILLQATVNYGAKAQDTFNIDAEHPADSFISNKGVFVEVDQKMINARLGDAGDTARAIDEDALAAYGLEYYGASLVMNSSTKIKLYFKITDADTYNNYKDTFTFGGKAVTPAYAGGSFISFTLDGIAAANLHVRYTLANTQGTATFDYAALDYASRCLEDKNSETEYDRKVYALTQALYWYNVFADAYFKGTV